MPAGFRYLLLDWLMIYSIFRVYSRKRLYRCNFSSKETNIYKISAKKGKLTLKIKLDSRDTPKESQNPYVSMMMLTFWILKDQAILEISYVKEEAIRLAKRILGPKLMKLTVNSFVPYVPSLYPWKQQKTVTWCFQGVKKVCIGNEWVKQLEMT